VDFAEIEALQHAGDWDKLTRQMIAAVQHLEQGGADFTVICTNTMHRMAGEIETATTIPLYQGCWADKGGTAGNTFHHGRRLLPGSEAPSTGIGWKGNMACR